MERGGEGGWGGQGEVGHNHVSHGLWKKKIKIFCT